MKKIAIIGGGCSAVIVALQLLSQRKVPCQITVFDPCQRLGLGVAYGTNDPLHCLNVPASRMGALAEAPDDFLIWLQEHGYSYQGGDFVPRVLYANYLTSRVEQFLKENAKFSGLTHIKKSVGRISKACNETNQWKVTAADGFDSLFDDVVLALGLPEGGWPRGIKGLEESFSKSPSQFIENVWEVPHTENIRNKVVGILGTGLSAIDVAMSALTKEKSTQVVLLSRHGLLPKSHFSDAATRVPNESAQFSGSLREVTRKFRELCKIYRWDAVIDAIRPSIPTLWSSWGPAERERFHRHLRHVWDVHRHRMAPHIASQVSEWSRSGRIQVVSGRILEATLLVDRIQLSVRTSHSKDPIYVLVDKLFNCTGFRTFSSSDYFGLLNQLEEEKIIRLDSSGSGIEPKSPLSLSLHPGLYVLGALLRAVRWESIAVPELREQGREIVQQILGT